MMQLTNLEYMLSKTKDKAVGLKEVCSDVISRFMYKIVKRTIAEKNEDSY
jgi:hypothetical protein